MNVHIIKGIFTERNESLNACIDIGGTCIHKKHWYEIRSSGGTGGYFSKKTWCTGDCLQSTFVK